MKTDKNIPCAFTLIELLVVISIIAMLMAILLPALSATKQQALKTVCMTHLFQWGMLFSLYAEDNDDMFFSGYYNYTDPNGTTFQSSDSETWPYLMEPYYEDSKLKFCPAARQSWNRSYSSRSFWGDESDDIFSGSYGLNGWICNPPEKILENEGHHTQNNWRSAYPYKGNRSKIPLMADAYWFTGLPEDSDLPAEKYDDLPDYDMFQREETDMAEDDLLKDTNNQMRRFCVDRHRKKLNVLFLDGSMQTISPKELWRLKWNRQYDTDAPLPEWPKWMSQFKDPD